MDEVLAVVEFVEASGRKEVDYEVRVRTLDALYRACREAPAGRLVRVTLVGAAGEVAFNFASILRED